LNGYLKRAKGTKKAKRPNHKVPNTGVYGTFAFGPLIGLKNLKKPTSGITSGIGMTTPSYYGGGQPHTVGTIGSGLYLRPSLGVRFPAKIKTPIFIDIGCVIQFSSRGCPPWGGSAKVV
jgi:hypothetical protein